MSNYSQLNSQRTLRVKKKKKNLKTFFEFIITNVRFLQCRTMVASRTISSPGRPLKRARSQPAKSSAKSSKAGFPMYKVVRSNAGNQPFAPQRRCTLRYTELLTFTAAAGATGYHVFSANGLYDPSVSGVGTQPLYFDQLMAIYDHYTVLNARIRVSFSPGNTNQETQLCGIHVDDDAGPGTVSGALFAQRPGCIARLMSPEANMPVILHSWNAAKTHGGNPMSKRELSGDASANPSEGSFFIVWAQNTAVATTQALDVFVQIEYDTVFHELKTIAAS